MFFIVSGDRKRFRIRKPLPVSVVDLFVRLAFVLRVPRLSPPRFDSSPRLFVRSARRLCNRIFSAAPHLHTQGAFRAQACKYTNYFPNHQVIGLFLAVYMAFQKNEQC